MTAHDWNGRLVPFPADRAAAYRASGEWSGLPTTARLHESALRHADRIALITAEGTYTYRELDERTDRIAAGLTWMGLRRLDPVIFQVTNRAATVLAWYGVLKAGLIPVATLSQHRMHEIGHISEKVDAVAHLVEAGLSFDLVDFAREVGKGHSSLRYVLSIEAPEVEPGVHRIEDLGADIDLAEARALVETIEADADPEDIAVFQLSGGTTGVPKVIPRIHAEYWNNGVFYARAFGWNEQTRVAHLLPIIHNAGISCALHAAHAVGATLVLATPDPVAAFKLMARSDATDVLIGHGHYQAAHSAGFDPVLRTVRRTVLSGAKVPAELFRKLDDSSSHSRWAGQMFGMSEGMFIVTPQDAPASARADTVGLPIAPSDEIRILDPSSEEELPAGAVGELCCRGPYTIPGYFGAPEHNTNAFTSDGFYRTGDLAALHEFGSRRYVAIEGRIKDLINRGGEKVNAEEIELLLLRHPDIAAAAVVAMPDDRLGEKACAYLVPESTAELTMAAVQEHLNALGVAKFKWPERLVWVPALPRTNVGKVNKNSLRADIVERLEAETLEGAHS
ncbi:(2,3-dihydroxybenzoyl)adenylate synthase [Hoyosella altamirensis]|uniref:2,3-dihydroxybenzoate-AMP ligase n=1 Tax=Hoyosella altamirensis TaxID=616997 RepID=A0A839RI95_9ACTN|nr:AMP-binding protein [Hoyosella altamirensis]MBB3035914.1 2,3-dihydroxybenzoate-AMP ligase [Hoyosella altamirensis]